MTLALASILVVALFGLLIGVIMQIVHHLLPNHGERPAADGAEPETTAAPPSILIKRARDAADSSVQKVHAMPRSGKFAILVFYALIAMMVVVIQISPVTMNWWAFAGGVFGGFLIGQLLFWLAKTNRLRAQPSKTPEAAM